MISPESYISPTFSPSSILSTTLTTLSNEINAENIIAQSNTSKVDENSNKETNNSFIIENGEDKSIQELIQLVGNYQIEDGKDVKNIKGNNENRTVGSDYISGEGSNIGAGSSNSSLNINGSSNSEGSVYELAVDGGNGVKAKSVVEGFVKNDLDNDNSWERDLNVTIDINNLLNNNKDNEINNKRNNNGNIQSEILEEGRGNKPPGFNLHPNHTNQPSFPQLNHPYLPFSNPHPLNTPQNPKCNTSQIEEILKVINESNYGVNKFGNTTKSINRGERVLTDVGGSFIGGSFIGGGGGVIDGGLISSNQKDVGFVGMKVGQYLNNHNNNGINKSNIVDPFRQIPTHSITSNLSQQHNQCYDSELKTQTNSPYNQPNHPNSQFDYHNNYMKKIQNNINHLNTNNHPNTNNHLNTNNHPNNNSHTNNHPYNNYHSMVVKLNEGNNKRSMEIMRQCMEMGIGVKRRRKVNEKVRRFECSKLVELFGEMRKQRCCKTDGKIHAQFRNILEMMICKGLTANWLVLNNADPSIIPQIYSIITNKNKQSGQNKGIEGVRDTSTQKSRQMEVDEDCDTVGAGLEGSRDNGGKWGKGELFTFTCGRVVIVFSTNPRLACNLKTLFSFKHVF